MLLRLYASYQWISLTVWVMLILTILEVWYPSSPYNDKKGYTWWSAPKFRSLTYHRDRFQNLLFRSCRQASVALRKELINFYKTNSRFSVGEYFLYTKIPLRSHPSSNHLTTYWHHGERKKPSVASQPPNRNLVSWLIYFWFLVDRC